MPVHDYSDGGGPGGFCGFRVTGWDGEAREIRQAYFSLREGGRVVGQKKRRELWRAAKALDEQWRAERVQARKKASANATDVPGILAMFAHHRGLYYPIFKAAGANESGRFQKAFYISRHGYEQAWRLAVDYRARQKGERAWRHRYHLCPPRSQFARIRRAMMARGHNVPASRLP